MDIINDLPHLQSVKENKTLEDNQCGQSGAIPSMSVVPVSVRPIRDYCGLFIDMT